MDENLPDFVAHALQQSTPENRHIDLGSVPDSIIEYFNRNNDIDLTGYKFTIDIYAIRHIMKSHGNAVKEEARGQKSVTVEDFGLIYQIVTKSDVVFYDGQNKIGRDVIQFQKLIGDQYIILKEIRTGRKQLALNSMRVIHKKRNQD